MLLHPVAKALAPYAPFAGILFGVGVFVLPHFLGYHELGLTNVLSMKVSGLLLLAISIMTLILKFYLARQRVAIERLIREASPALREPKDQSSGAVGEGVDRTAKR